MKEILFHNFSSQDHRRKFVALRQTLEKGKTKITIFKKCVYIIVEIKKINKENLLPLINSLIPEKGNGNHFFIKKRVDHKRNTKFISYNLKGKFYVVKEDYLYTISLNQEIDLDFQA